MATVYAVASAKGGVGKTTTTAAIATILAESGADVVAIDADIGMANLAGALGVTPGETTIHDVLADRAVPLDAVHDGPAGLRVVPGAADLDAYAAADPSGLKDVVAAFDDADYVFIDAGAGLSHDSTLPLGLAAETLLVSTPEPSALGDTEKTRQLTERLGGSVAGAAITRVSDAAEDSEIESEDETESEGQDDTETDDVVAELLDATVLGRIPEDEAVLLAAEAGAPLPMFAPDSPATRAYRDLAQALTDTEIDGSGLGVGSAGGATADETREDERERGEDRPAESDGEETGESDGKETGESDGEDIIVADSEQAGLGEPHSEEDIIVADESPVTERDGDEQERHEAKEPEGGDEAADAVSGASDVTTTTDTVDDETEMVGRDHVNGDDLEAMIEDDLDEAAFDDDSDDSDDPDDSDDSDDNATAADEDVVQEPTAGDEPGVIADADEVASTADGNEAGDPDEREVDDDGDSQDDIDDELAGSVPFRDDDTGTTSTALSESDDDGTESGDTTDEADEADETEQTDDTKRGGFFSRLLGR